MDDVDLNRSQQVPRVPRKPLDNPWRSKPAYPSDEECARLLGHVFRQLPILLRGACGTKFPLLEALRDVNGDLARQLIVIAAAAHRDGDERRTAEYFLRHRVEFLIGRRSALALVRAARFSGEMERRRFAMREVSALQATMTALDVQNARPEAPSVADMVIAKLQSVTGHVRDAVADRIGEAVVIALELAERHHRGRGSIPSLLGMRADARPESRLVTHLRRRFDDALARPVARLLVGSDDSSIETALLWWSTRPTLRAEDVPAEVRARWVRCVRAAENALVHRVIHRSELLGV